LFILFFTLLITSSRGDTEFAHCLEPVRAAVGDENATVWHKMAGAHERVAWEIGCNFQRERHPLLAQQQQHHAVKPLAEPTAVHVSILQSIAPSQPSAHELN